MSWQPIETAPKNYRDILLSIDNQAWVGRSSHTAGDYVVYGLASIQRPTHWMPLPQKPGTSTPDDFDDLPAMRREIQRLNERIDRMTCDHVSQIERYKTDNDEMAKYIAGHSAANQERANDIAFRVLGWAK